MKNDKNVAKEEWLRCFSYDPATGAFERIVRTGRRGWNAEKGKGKPHHTGYVYLRLHNSIVAAHRVAWLFITGDWPRHTVDHINLDKADNRWCNLRDATYSENCINRLTRSDNKLGIKGVHKRKRSGSFVATITVKGKRRTLGYFAESEMAELAYAVASERFHGKFSNLGSA